MFKLTHVPTTIAVDYGIMREFPHVAQECVFLADRVWNKALLLGIAYAEGVRGMLMSSSTSIPMSPSKSVHYFQRARDLASKLEPMTRKVAMEAIDSVFDQVMSNQSLKRYFYAAILNDYQLTPTAAQRLGVSVPAPEVA